MNELVSILVVVMYIFSNYTSWVIRPEYPRGATEMRVRVVADTEWSLTSYAPPEPLTLYYGNQTLLSCSQWTPFADKSDGRLDCGYSQWTPVFSQPELLQDTTYRPGYYWLYIEYRIGRQFLPLPFISRAYVAQNQPTIPAAYP